MEDKLTIDEIKYVLCRALVLIDEPEQNGVSISILIKSAYEKVLEFAHHNKIRNISGGCDNILSELYQDRNELYNDFNSDAYLTSSDIPKDCQETNIIMTYLRISKNINQQ